MFTSFLIALLCLASGTLSISQDLPCEVSDIPCIENFVNTIAPKILSGVPELGVKTSSPLFVEEIIGNLSILKYKLFNCSVDGYKKCKIGNMSLNEATTKVRYDFHCPSLFISGIYEIKGRLVIMPVEGEGDFSIAVGEYLIHVESDLKKVEKNGKTYVTIKNIKLKCVPLTGSRFDFKNLFNGQKDLSDAVHKFANENWLEVSELVQDPVWNTCLAELTKNVNKYLKQVPLEDILPK